MFDRRAIFLRAHQPREWNRGGIQGCDLRRMAQAGLEGSRANNRTGYRKQVDGGTEYFVLPEA